jgi:hypothetical protein
MCSRACKVKHGLYRVRTHAIERRGASQSALARMKASVQIRGMSTAFTMIGCIPEASVIVEILD